MSHSALLVDSGLISSVPPGLIAAGIVSAWTWAATLLQSSATAYKFGISGPWWYASGACIQGESSPHSSCVTLGASPGRESKGGCRWVHGKHGMEIDGQSCYSP